MLALAVAVLVSAGTAALAFRVGLRRRSGAWVFSGSIALLSALIPAVALCRVLVLGSEFSIGEALAWPVLSLVVAVMVIALWGERRRLERHRASVRDASARRLRAGAQQKRVADDLRRSLGELQRELDEERQSRVRISRDRLELEQTSATLSQRLRLVGSGTNDGIWSVQLEARTAYFSPRFNEILGLPSEESVGTLDEWLDRVHADDREAVRAALETPVTEGQQRASEHRIRHAAGFDLWVRIHWAIRSDSTGRPIELAGSLSDLSERGPISVASTLPPSRDSLTGLETGARLIERLRAAMARNIREREFQFAVLYVDIDRFKRLSSGIGRAAGDKMLAIAARKLEQCLPSEHAVMRIGGDKFAVLLVGMPDLEAVTECADRLLDVIEDPIPLEKREVCMSGSIGIAWSGLGYTDPEEMIRDADTALRRAKRRGGGSSQTFDAVLRQQEQDRWQIENDLLQGVPDDQFHLVYQPIVSLASGRIHGFEALVRWTHPERGLIPPDKFIPVAEETGAIVLIGRRVLAEACRQCRQWHDRFGPDLPLSMHVNVSGSQLLHPKLVSDVAAVIRKSGVDASRLKLEITESVMMTPDDAKLLAKLKKLSVSLCVDDFGAGYSSFSYLARFPFDTLKIDKALIADMARSSECIELVRAIVVMAKALGIRLVAEGVETGAQLMKLRELGCDYAQGYFFGRPISAEEATKLIAREVEALDAPIRRVALESPL